MDDAQSIHDDGWNMALSRSGGGRGASRDLYRDDGTKESASSVLVYAEAPYMQFTVRFAPRTGWDNRLRYYVPPAPPDDHEEDPTFSDRMRGREGYPMDDLQEFIMWLIDGDNTDSVDSLRAPREMREFAIEVHRAALKQDGKGKDLPTAIRNFDGSVNDEVLAAGDGSVAAEPVESPSMTATRDAMDALERSGEQPTVALVTASLNAAGVTNSRGGPMSEHIVKPLVREVRAKRKLAGMSASGVQS